MRPLKLIIPGKYWDSQIYAGRLYLFTQDGEIIILDWDKLIEGWKIEEEARIALVCAFQRSDYLYDPSLKTLLHDLEVKRLIEKKFILLSEKHLEVTPKHMKKVLIRKQNNSCPFPHSDSEIYRYNLFICSKIGVFRASCNKRNKYPVSLRPEKKWDAPVFGISASYGNLALAAGNEGLYELKIEEFSSDYFGNNANLLRLSRGNCIDCNWTFHSIYGSSHISSGYLASFIKEKSLDNSMHFNRKLKEVISDEYIFQNKGYSWGVQDKLCLANNGRIEIVKYKHWEENIESQLISLVRLNLKSWKGNVISGGTAVFGVIIECENAIVVLPSAGRIVTFRGEPINWRVFPRSKHYENQLHLIYDERLEVYSFNNDYFVDQDKKNMGIKFYSY